MADGRGIALGGFMGVGKSTVGAALARRLRWPLVDLDEVLTERHGPIPEQFARDGEAVFRAREEAAVRALCDGQQRVLATGGGTWVDPQLRALLRERYFTVVLEAPVAELRRRVSGDGRPLWDDAVEERLAARAEAYADAELHVQTAGREPEAVVEAIVEAWEVACR